MTRSSSQHGLRIGLDLGGSKIGGVLVGRGAKKWARYRVDATRRLRGYYRGHCRSHSQAHAGHRAGAKIGIAVPGSISPLTGLMQNAIQLGSTGRAFDRDLALALATPVRLANDANCFAHGNFRFWGCPPRQSSAGQTPYSPRSGRDSERGVI
jgi:fructokinase